MGTSAFLPRVVRAIIIRYLETAPGLPDGLASISPPVKNGWLVKISLRQMGVCAKSPQLGPTLGDPMDCLIKYMEQNTATRNMNDQENTAQLKQGNIPPVINMAAMEICELPSNALKTIMVRQSVEKDFHLPRLGIQGDNNTLNSISSFSDDITRVSSIQTQLSPTPL